MIRNVRCCMCPNGGGSENKVCPAGGLLKPTETVCDFVLDYYDKDGALVCVSPGRDGHTWMTVRKKTPRSGGWRVISNDLPVCRTRDEAQADLNAYAQKKGWAVCSD